MEITNNTGTVLVIHNNELKVMTYNPGCYFGSYNFTDNKDTYEAPEYDDRFDVYFHQSDNGETIYNAFHVIGDSNHALVTLPDIDEVKRQAKIEITPLMERLINDNCYACDFKFGQTTLSNITWLYTRWCATGSIADAQKAILRDVFEV